MAKKVISESQKIHEGKALARFIQLAKQNDSELTQESIGDQLEVTQGVVGQWVKGMTALTDMRVLELSILLRFDPSELRPSLRRLVNGIRELPDIRSAPANYTLENAPVCDSEYIIELPGGTLPNYDEKAYFQCLKYDDKARENAQYVVFRKHGNPIPVVCVQLGSKMQRNYLGELVGGRRVDRPELLHTLDSGEILCAIRRPKDDSQLWGE